MKLTINMSKLWEDTSLMWSIMRYESIEALYVLVQASPNRERMFSATEKAYESFEDFEESLYSGDIDGIKDRIGKDYFYDFDNLEED